MLVLFIAVRTFSYWFAPRFATYLPPELYEFILHIISEAPVAQLDRALASGAKGWGFESLLAYKANFNIFKSKASNFGGPRCLHIWTNVDKKGQKSHPKSHSNFNATLTKLKSAFQSILCSLIWKILQQTLDFISVFNYL